MNNCINLKKKLNGNIFCKKYKKIILINECSSCKFKKYNHIIYNERKKKKINKRTKALTISKKVKMIVWERDGHMCIFCKKIIPWNMANSHFIKRSHGGLGIEENIFCACQECHNKFDDTIERIDMLPYAEFHLKSKYNNWNKDILTYKKK